MTELKVLISRQEIAKRVSELGAQITKDFAGQSVIFVGVLKGAAIFLSDLARYFQPKSVIVRNRAMQSRVIAFARRLRSRR